MFIEPMLLETEREAFDSDKYLFQPKLDGHRMIWSRISGKVRMYTRHQNEVTLRYEELHDLLDNTKTDTVIDGEICVLSADGRTDFELMQERFRVTKPDKIKLIKKKLPVVLFPFDIMIYNGKDIRNLPLLERLKYLEEAIPNSSLCLRKVLTVDTFGKNLDAAVRQQEGEGIVAKLKESRYVGIRSSNWKKIINEHQVEAYITGLRKNKFGWLCSIEGTDGKLVPAGIIEFGVKPEEKDAFRNIYRNITTTEDRNYTYIEPYFKCRIRTRGFTKNGLLRIPVFDGFLF